MAAFGSGAVQQSIGSDCLNVDIGGGTDQDLTLCRWQDF